HAVLETHRDRDREAVHDAAERGPLLVHVDEDLAQRPVLVLAGAPERLVSGDPRLRGEAVAAARQAPAAQLGRSGRGLVALLAGERLTQLAAVAVQRHRLEPELPRLEVDALDVLDGRVGRQV